MKNFTRNESECDESRRNKKAQIPRMAGMLGETPVETPVSPAAAAGGLFQPQADENSSDGSEQMDTGSAGGGVGAKLAPDPLGETRLVFSHDGATL